jgi:uncharacterized membrane protein YccF (DUF307 family)
VLLAPRPGCARFPYCQAGSTAEKPMLRFLLNVLWFVLGGVVMSLGWWLAGLVAAITIVGLPWARACFVIGNYSFWPFGNETVSRRELTGRNDFGTGPLGLIGNVIWFLVAGWWLAIGHLTSAVACFVTIIGIPFGIQHIKLAPGSARGSLSKATLRSLQANPESLLDKASPRPSQLYHPRAKACRLCESLIFLF